MTKISLQILAAGVFTLVISCSQGEIWDPSKHEAQLIEELNTARDSVSTGSSTTLSSTLNNSSIKSVSSTQTLSSQSVISSISNNTSSSQIVSSSVAPSSAAQGARVAWTANLWTWDGSNWIGPSCVKDGSNKEYVCNSGKENGCNASDPDGPFGPQYYTAK